MNNELIRCTFNLPTIMVDQLKNIAKKRQTSVTNVVRCAIGTEAFFEEKERQGAKFLIEENGDLYEVYR